jgi:hypothetical protein
VVLLLRTHDKRISSRGFIVDVNSNPDQTAIEDDIYAINEDTEVEAGDSIDDAMVGNEDDEDEEVAGLTRDEAGPSRTQLTPRGQLPKRLRNAHLFPHARLNEDGVGYVVRQDSSSIVSNSSLDNFDDLPSGTPAKQFTHQTKKTAPEPASDDEEDETYLDATEGQGPDEEEALEVPGEQEHGTKGKGKKRVDRLEQVHAICAKCNDNDAADLITFIDAKQYRLAS